MAGPVTIKGYQLQILIGDGASPEVFAAKCLVNTTREFTVEATTIDTAVPDCDTPENPAWIVRDKDTLSGRVNGSGRHHITDNAFFDAWIVDDAPKNCRIKENFAGGRTWSGQFHLTTYTRRGEQRGLVDAEIALVSTGVLTSGANA